MKKLLAGLILAAGLLLAPSTASAQYVEECSGDGIHHVMQAERDYYIYVLQGESNEASAYAMDKASEVISRTCSSAVQWLIYIDYYTNCCWSGVTWNENYAVMWSTITFVFWELGG